MKNHTPEIQASDDPSAAVEPVAPRITLDFKQATELLEMFGGEPAAISLRTCTGHSGEGLYAHWADLPEEGATYLGMLDDDATPVAAPAAEAEPADGCECVNCANGFGACHNTAKAEPVPTLAVDEREAFDDFFRKRNGLHPDTDTTFRSDAAEPWKYWQGRAALAATPADPAPGNWTNADDVDRLARSLNVALNGDGAASQASLCDVVGQVVHAARELGRPLLAVQSTPAHPAAPAEPTPAQREVIAKLLELARIVERAVEDWGESHADGSSHVIFHKDEADARDAILDYFDSLPENPDPQILDSGPIKAARALFAALAAPAPAWADQAVIEYQYTGGAHWCPLGPAERMSADFDGVYRLQPGAFPTLAAPADALDAARLAFREYLSVHDGINLGGQALDDIALDLARIASTEAEVLNVIRRRIKTNSSGQLGEDKPNIRAAIAAQAQKGGE